MAANNSSENVPVAESAFVKVTSDLPTDVLSDFSNTKEGRKSQSDDQFLHVPSSRLSIDSISGLSNFSLEELSAARPTSRSLYNNGRGRLPSRSPAPQTVNGGRFQRFWEAQKGVVLMILAQFFGAAMSTTARFMETTDQNGDPMDTFQILFVRMSVTSASCIAYMWWMKVPDAPFGKKEVRWLLLARGFGGFFGVFGLYYSLVYLPLAEATVITFLAPMVAAWVCSIVIKTPFTRTQQMAFVVSLAGVVLIAQPLSFLKAGDSAINVPRNSTMPAGVSNSTAVGEEKSLQHDVTPSEHIYAVAIGLLGVCGAATAYTTISWIGKRAHPLIIINYFAVWCVIVSVGALTFSPTVSFRLPAGWYEWALMFFLGFSGFIMQFLLTAALAHTRGGKGLNMVYTQMLFALAFDKLVWGTTPDAVSIIGSSMILGSAIWVAMKKEEKKEPPTSERQDEEQGLVAGMEAPDESRSSEDIHSRRAPEMELQPLASEDSRPR